MPNDTIQNSFNSTLLNCECQQSECMTTTYQYPNIDVPVEITSTAALDEIKAECSGEPIVLCKESKCSDTCEIVISQKICVEIPIIYTVKTCIGESETTCDCDN